MRSCVCVCVCVSFFLCSVFVSFFVCVFVFVCEREKWLLASTCRSSLEKKFGVNSSRVANYILVRFMLLPYVGKLK